VIVGYGRVGRVIAEGLQRDGNSFLVIEEREEEADRLRKSAIEVIQGNGVNAEVLNAANLIAARWLFVAIPDGFEAGQVVEQARKISADLPIVARAHSDAEVEHLRAHGASFAIMGEREIGLGMLEYAYGRPAKTATGVAAPHSASPVEAPR
jgi:CPA2 family monovalent cation:H+ antiporter-2